MVLALDLLPAKVAQAPGYTIWLCFLVTKSRFLQLQGPHFSWKQTPTRIHHLGPSKLRPEQPGGANSFNHSLLKGSEKRLKEIVLDP